MAIDPLDPPPIQNPIAHQGSLLVTTPWALWFRKLLSQGGSGITQLIGDVLAGPGSGTQVATLSATGVTPDTYGDATHVGQFTVDIKGRITAATEIAIVSGGTPAPPDTSIQFNDAGAFGGDASWIFDRPTTSVALGLGHDFGTGGSANLLVGAGHQVI